MRRRAAVSMAEVDTFTRWRHRMAYLAHAGVKDKIKKGARRRERHDAKARIRHGEAD